MKKDVKKDVLIKIRGVYIVDGSRDVVELMTMGRFYRKNGNYYISYDESEATGFKDTKTTLKVERDDRVTMLRSGAARSQLIIERGVRHQCLYGTGAGDLTIGVSGDEIISNLTEDGGELEFKYSLDINTSLTSENEVYISVEHAQEC